MAQKIDAQGYFVRGTANIFATDYVVLENYDPAGRGNPLYQTDAISSDTWWNFTVDVMGETYLTLAESDQYTTSRADTRELQKRALSEGFPNSILKIELEYRQGNSRVRTVRFDVAAGLDVYVPPTRLVKARVLGPDPTSVPAVLPVGFDPDAQFASALVLTARCCSAPVAIPAAKFTQPFYLTAGGGAQDSIAVGVTEGATRAFLTAGTPLTGNALEALLVRRTPNGTVLDTTTLGETNARGAAPADNFTETKEIPGPANTLRYTNVGAGAQVGSIIQLLQM